MSAPWPEAVTVLDVPIVLDGWLLLAALAVAAGGFLRGFTGFGSALAIIPVLALVFGPKAAVAMHAIMEIPVILHLVHNAVGKAERATVAPMLLALLVGTPIGALALAVADPEVMRLVISVMVLAMVGLIAGRERLTVFRGHRGALAAGAAGGLIQGATGVGGPPIVAALLARGDPPVTARANIAIVMSAMLTVSIVTFAAYGLIDRQVLVVGALAAPLCLAATVAGSLAFARAGGRGHRGMALAVISVTALGTIASGTLGAGR